MSILPASPYYLMKDICACLDKVDKTNYVLENVIENRKEPLDGRLAMWFFSNIIPNAGQWDMLVNLVKKCGVTRAHLARA